MQNSSERDPWAHKAADERDAMNRQLEDIAVRQREREQKAREAAHAEQARKQQKEHARAHKEAAAERSRLAAKAAKAEKAAAAEAARIHEKKMQKLAGAEQKKWHEQAVKEAARLQKKHRSSTSSRRDPPPPQPSGCGSKIVGTAFLAGLLIYALKDRESSSFYSSSGGSGVSDVFPESTPVKPFRPVKIGAVVRNHDDGARIESVVGGAPADLAGLQPDDIITSVNGSRIRNAEAFTSRIRGGTAGEAMTLAFKRGESNLTAEVTPLLESDFAKPAPKPKEGSESSVFVPPPRPPEPMPELPPEALPPAPPKPTPEAPPKEVPAIVEKPSQNEAPSVARQQNNPVPTPDSHLLRNRTWNPARYGRQQIGAGIEDKVMGKEGNWVFLTGIVEDSPAHKAGLHAGDQILSIDNRSVLNAAGFISRVGATPPGNSILLKYRRGDENRSVTITPVAAD